VCDLYKKEDLSLKSCDEMSFEVLRIKKFCGIVKYEIVARVNA